MAGFNLSGLPYFMQYQQQAQQDAIAKQKAQQEALSFQQAQQDRQSQQAAMAAAGNALPQLMAGGQPAMQPQMPPPPQPPAPGQPSQPMQQAGGGVPLPQGPVPGQVNLPPLPPGGVQGQVPPFRTMPTAPPPQQMAVPAQIGPPPDPTAPPQQPQGGGWTMQQVLKGGTDQGLTGKGLYDYMGLMMPVMDAQSKAQAAQLQQQFQHELQIATLQERYDALRQQADNNALNREQRAQAHQDSLGIQQQMVDLRRQARSGGSGASTEPAPDLKPDAQGNLPAPKPVAGFSSEAIQALAEDYAVRGPTALAGFGYKNMPPAARAEIVNYAAAKNKQTGGNFASNKIQYAADTAGARVNAQQAAKVDAAANALVQPDGIGDQFQQAMDALERTGVPIANQAQMEILRQKFDPRVSAYDMAQNGVVSELAQILGRGQLTVNSMEEARKRVENWHTSAQAKAGLAQAKREAATTVKASSEEVAKSARTPKGQPGAMTRAPAQNAKGWNLMTDKNGNRAYVSPDGKQYEEVQ